MNQDVLAKLYREGDDFASEGDALAPEGAMDNSPGWSEAESWERPHLQAKAPEGRLNSIANLIFANWPEGNFARGSSGKAIDQLTR